MTGMEIAAIASAVLFVAFLAGMLLSLAGAALRRAEDDLRPKERPTPERLRNDPELEMTDHWQHERGIDRGPARVLP